MMGLKVRKVGNSLGVVLPKEVTSRLGVRVGARLFLIEAPNGAYQLTPYDPDFKWKMEKAEGGRHYPPLSQHLACPRQEKNMIWIDERDVLAIHGRLLALEGGQSGVRDQKLLESVLARPRQLQGSGDNPDIDKMATSYMSGIVRDRPFTDGNEGTGFVIGVLFLELNGHRFNPTEESAAQMMIALAAGVFDVPVPATRRRAKTKRRKAR